MYLYFTQRKDTKKIRLVSAEERPTPTCLQEKKRITDEIRISEIFTNRSPSDLSRGKCRERGEGWWGAREGGKEKEEGREGGGERERNGGRERKGGMEGN